jgi:hypothetical protein
VKEETEISGLRPLTCHAFALDLLEIERLTTPEGKPVVPSSEFIGRIIAVDLEELDGPEDDCLVVYFDQDEVQHSGRWRSGRVVSKWGTGHIWSHQVFETPASYGCMARTFRALTPEALMRLWREHMRPFVERQPSAVRLT